MKHRISSGALVVENSRVLLVRHQREGRYDFWVAPGGGVCPGEGGAAAAIREAKEETGIDVEVIRLAIVEELHNPDERICKLWFYCRMTGGTLSAAAEEATREYIVDTQFFSREQLAGKTVYPPTLAEDKFWNQNDRAKGHERPAIGI